MNVWEEELDSPP